MNCKTAKSIDLVSYLKKQGFSISETKTKNTWFYSPFRVEERTPSFKVDIIKNIWFDFGEGIGGSIIDFVMKYNNCSIEKALEILDSNTFSFHQQQPKIKEQAPNYSIKKITEITNPNLLNYLSDRKINLVFGKSYLFQVNYSFDAIKEYYGIGFKNDSGGFEIRNKYFKGCLGKKEITTIKGNSDIVCLFESWSDFLSYLTLKKEVPDESFIILNSTSMVKKVLGQLVNYNRLKVFFDNDTSGDNAFNFICKYSNVEVEDCRVYYKNFKDLNEYLINKKI